MSSEQLEEAVLKSGVLFAARESVRAALATSNIDIDFDLKSVFDAPSSSSSSSSAPFHDLREQKNVAEWIMAQDTGYSSSMRSAFFGLCKFRETRNFLKSKLVLFEETAVGSIHSRNKIHVSLVKACDTQVPDVACHAELIPLPPSEEQDNKTSNAKNMNNSSINKNSPPTRLKITFSLRSNREQLRGAHDMHRLEHAIVHVFSPEYKTHKLFGRVNSSARLPETQNSLRHSTGNKHLVVDFGWDSVAAMTMEDQISTADWVSGHGYHGTMTGAFALLCRFPLGKETLAKMDKVCVVCLSGGGAQPYDVVTKASAGEHTLFLTFWLRSGVYLRSSIDSHKLENSIVAAFPQLKAGHTRERIGGSGELERVRLAVCEATHQSESSGGLSVEMDYEKVCEIEDKDERRHATQWIIGEDWTIRGEQRRNRMASDEEKKNGNGQQSQQQQTNSGKKSLSASGNNNNNDVEDDDDDEDDASNNDDKASVVSATTTVATETAINRRHPSPMLNTIKVAFISLCKFKSGREVLVKFQKITIEVEAAAPGTSQPSDIVCAAEADEDKWILHLKFTLRATRELMATSDSLQLARKISLALPQLQRGRDTEMITNAGRLEPLQDNIRWRMQNFHLLFDVDFWSVTTLEPETVRHDIIKWICSDGLDSTLRNGFKALMKNSCALAVFDKFRRLEITCAVTESDAKLLDIVSCTATTANIDNIVGVVNSATVGAKAAAPSKGALEPGSVGSWRRLPALNLQFVFRVTDRNIRSDYDCSQKLESAVLAVIPELKRAHDKDLVEASGRLESLQKDINEALTSSKKTSSSSSSSTRNFSSFRKRRASMSSASLLTSLPSPSSLSSSSSPYHDNTAKSPNKRSSTTTEDAMPITVELDYDDVLSLQGTDMQHAMLWLTTDAAFANTMRLAFSDLAHNDLFMHEFQDFTKIVVHVFARWVPPEDAAAIKERHILQKQKSFSGTSTAATLASRGGGGESNNNHNNNSSNNNNNNNNEGVSINSSNSGGNNHLTIAVPGDLVFEALFMRPALHLNFVLCRGDSAMPPLSNEARRLERAILAAAKEAMERH